MVEGMETVKAPWAWPRRRVRGLQNCPSHVGTGSPDCLRSQFLPGLLCEGRLCNLTACFRFWSRHPPTRQCSLKELCNFPELPLVLCERGTAVVFAPRLVRGSGALTLVTRLAVQALGGGCYQHGGKQRGVPQ